MDEGRGEPQPRTDLLTPRVPGVKGVSAPSLPTRTTRPSATSRASELGHSTGNLRITGLFMCLLVCSMICLWLVVLTSSSSRVCDGLEPSTQ